ncbi:MAG: hypothetical protein LBB14_03040, partial [Puniceicoccales bacterium]|nr:hypothetical protein [Puniceicoccales bacterium]
MDCAAPDASRNIKLSRWFARRCANVDPTEPPNYGSVVAALRFGDYLDLLVAGEFAANRFIAFLLVIFCGYVRTRSCLRWWQTTFLQAVAASAGPVVRAASAKSANVPLPPVASAGTSAGTSASSTAEAADPEEESGSPTADSLPDENLAKIRDGGRLTPEELADLERQLELLRKEKPSNFEDSKTQLAWVKETRLDPAKAILFLLRDKAEECRKEVEDMQNATPRKSNIQAGIGSLKVE